MTEFEFYSMLLGNNPCSGCPVYEYLGHCGYTADCMVFEIEHFIQEVLNWDKTYFLNYIYFQEFLVPLFAQSEEYLEEEIENYILASF